MVAERLSGLAVTPIDYDGVPRVTYSDPEVASVGIIAAAAEARGIEITEFTYDLAGNGKARSCRRRRGEGHRRGRRRTGARHPPGRRARRRTDRRGQLIYNWEATPTDVAQLIHPHPTQSEALGEAHLALAGKPLHVHS